MIKKTKVEKSSIAERIKVDGWDYFRVVTDSGEWGVECKWAICDRPTDRRYKSETVVFLEEYAKEWFGICEKEDTDQLEWITCHQNGYDTCVETGLTRVFGTDSNEIECLRSRFALTEWEMLMDAR